MIARRLARAFGYDLLPLRKFRDLDSQLVLTLERQEIEAVVDVGANRGQYAMRLRAAGWRGPILSIEPIPEVHRQLVGLAARDPLWEVLPPMAMGAATGEIALDVSAESDMSSTLPQSATLRRVSPSSAVVQRIIVPQERLDSLARLRGSSWSRLFIKIDVQGAEIAVLSGCDELWDRIAGLQLEMALMPLYEGEQPWLEIVASLASHGFEPYLLFPGYFARALGRQVQMDMVFYRAEDGSGASAPAV